MVDKNLLFDFTFSATDFITACSWVTSVPTPAGSQIPTVVLKINDDNNSVTLNTIMNEGVRRVCLHSSNSTIAPSAHDEDYVILSKVISKLLGQITPQCDTVRLRLVETGGDYESILLTTKFNRINIALLSADFNNNCSREWGDDSRKVGSFNTSDLFNAANELSVLCDSSVDDVRFNSLDCAVSSNSLTFMSLDGYVLGTRRIRGVFEGADQGFTGKRIVMLNSDIVKMSAASSCSMVDVYASDESITFKFDDGRMSQISVLNVEPVDYHNFIMPERADNKIIVDGYEFKNTVSRLLSWTLEDYVTLVVDNSKKLLTVKSFSDDWESSISIIKNTPNNVNNTIVFPKVTLNKVIKSYDCDRLMLRYDNNPAGPVMFEEYDNNMAKNEDYYEIAMPQNVDEIMNLG